MQQLMKQAKKAQALIASAQAELATAEVTGAAGGGLVVATMTATGEMKSIRIDPQAVDPSDVETLEDLITVAVTNAIEAGRQVADEKMGPLTGGLGLPGF